MSQKPKPSSGIQGTVGGDVSGQLAAGESITQISTKTTSDVTNADLEEFRQLLATLRSKIKAEAQPGKKEAALERVGELEQSVTEQKPHLSTMEYVRNWKEADHVFTLEFACKCCSPWGDSRRGDLWSGRTLGFVARLVVCWNFRRFVGFPDAGDLSPKPRFAEGTNDGCWRARQVESGSCLCGAVHLAVDHRRAESAFSLVGYCPADGVVAGLVIVAISWGLTTWSVWVNPFFSPAVRIQEERGQRVISEGPYVIVRHPGYAGIALSMVASAVALNSLLAIIPAVMYLAVTVRQTAIEDRMLSDELAGYTEYAAKVRYRLIPGVW
jgi:Phospholipid methyltransferase